MCTERRERPRVHYFVDATVELEAEWHQAECRNISMGGMLLYTEGSVPMGARGKVKIDQQCGDEKMCIAADIEVIRVTEVNDQDGGYEIGVKFISLEAGNSIDLMNIVRYQSGEVMGEAKCSHCDCKGV